MHFMQKESNQEAPQSYNGPYGADTPGHPQTANTTKSMTSPRGLRTQVPKPGPRAPKAMNVQSTSQDKRGSEFIPFLYWNRTLVH